MNIQYDNKQRETTQISLLISEEEKQVKLIADDIRKTNRRISEIQKEKEQTRSAVMLLRKHIDQLKNKINLEVVYVYISLLNRRSLC
jgi:chromosome segregation ATPase